MPAASIRPRLGDDGGVRVVWHREPGWIPVLWRVCRPARRGHSAEGRGEERKVVTVLWAHPRGSPSRAEALDPEDVRAFLLPYYDVLTGEIERHGGHVDRFLGDGVMALFGAPTAHEDDPERAVRAALRILERIPALGLELARPPRDQHGRGAVRLGQRRRERRFGDR